MTRVVVDTGGMDETLRAAAFGLMSPDRAEREAGESVVIAARSAAVPALIEVLQHAARSAPGGLPHSPVARSALLVGALRARDAVPAMCAVVRAGRLAGDDGAFVARALAEILDTPLIRLQCFEGIDAGPLISPCRSHLIQNRFAALS